MSEPLVISNDEIVGMMHRMFPHETRIAILTVSNNRLMDMVAAQDEVIKGQRAEANSEVWRKELK